MQVLLSINYIQQVIKLYSIEYLEKKGQKIVRYLVQGFQGNEKTISLKLQTLQIFFITYK